MKFPLSLLKTFLKTDAPLEEIARVATAIGLEVDAIEDKSAALKPFVVAEILEAEKHPQADKLQVCKVKSPSGTLQIVCGAPNARAGIKVALANIGTIIPTNQMEIKAAKVRGVESQGMLCSARELGLGEDHAGIIELPLTATIGDSIVDVLGLNDPVIDLNITANRGDCMGVYGIARDLAAAGLGELVATDSPELSFRKGGHAQDAAAINGDKPHVCGGWSNDACAVTIRIEDTDACSAFIGRVVRNVKNGTAPEWLQHTLTAAGMRPISALVDITNYFTLAFGRPLHVYDLAKLKGGITVRTANDGEELLALNEKTYRLTSRDCVIADETGAIGIGGIMGGSSTAVDETTTSILLECAIFNPERIAKTGRALQIDSDARTRFERGVDNSFAETGERLAAAMIMELCGGTASAHSLTGNPGRSLPQVAYNAAQVNALTGVEVPEARQREILKKLGFTDEGASMRAPSWRHDVIQPADLAEEVLRIVGYDNIPLTPLPKPAEINRPALDAAQTRMSTLRRTAAARGLNETYSWGFCSEAQAALWGGQSEALKLLNPISADLAVMRPKIMPHLVDAVKNNLVRGIADIAIFELGATFHDVTPDGQRFSLSGVRTGNRTGLHWAETKKVDVFDVKADLLALLDAAGIDSSKCMVMPTKDAPWFHPGRSGIVGLGPKNILGAFGEIHPSILKQSGVDVPVYAFALFISALPATKATRRKALTTSDFQSTSRDFAFVVDETLPAAELIKHVSAAEKQLLRDITLFDIYQGKGVEPGKKSIALTVTLQADDRTLTEAEIEAVSNAIVTSAKKVGATLR